ncbi:PepSY-associated TM helix domain-containing protein [Olivibacter ginsenosidimutans]|uniref:PepSY-associated TM helix domain-containing protein n=1 Tax=Olivibacter ginsenosidimutans TaxID=1176537 RepID=A0ABP9AZ02_9SPHI
MTSNSRKGKSIGRRVNEWLHLWLGLISGLMVFFVCLSGVLFVFHDEVNNFINRDARFVTVPEHPVRVSPDTILANLRRQYPTVRTNLYTAYADPRKAVKIMCSTPNPNQPMLGLGSAYANPYTGEILKIDNTYGIFRLLAAFHMNLLLGNVGSQLVRIATITFLIELISGFIWWWPTKWNKSTRDKSFKVKWNAKWKRLNIDLHNVLGFYSLPLAMVLTVTALILCYKPVKDFFFWTFGHKGTDKTVFQALPQADSTKNALSLDQLLQGYQSELGIYAQLSIGVPNPRSGAVMLRMEHESSMVTYRGKQLYLDIYTGKKLESLPLEAIREAKMMNTNIALHIGTWYGLPVKIITFVVCLICTSLPITGFLIWYNRKFKKKKGTTRRKPTLETIGTA